MSMPVYCLPTEGLLKIVHRKKRLCIYVMWMMILLLRLVPLAEDDEQVSP
jgi:hypothetical protein